MVYLYLHTRITCVLTCTCSCTCTCTCGRRAVLGPAPRGAGERVVEVHRDRHDTPRAGAPPHLGAARTCTRGTYMYTRHVHAHAHAARVTMPPTAPGRGEGWRAPRTYTCTRAWTRTHVCASVCACACVCACDLHAHVHMHVHMFMCTCMGMGRMAAASHPSLDGCEAHAIEVVVRELPNACAVEAADVPSVWLGGEGKG